MGLVQFENFRKILQTQLDQLIKVMDSLPTGSVKPVFEELTKSKMPKPDSPYVKILVTKSGEIILDGSNTSIDVSKNELTALAQQNGVVLYSRDSPEEPQPPAIVKTVINLVIENRLPIRMCQKSDFSDAIDSNGKLRSEE